MPNLKDPLEEQEVKEIRDKQEIKGTIYYLIKQVGQLLEYNFFKPTNYLINALKAIKDFKHRKKHKEKEITKKAKIDKKLLLIYLKYA